MAIPTGSFLSTYFQLQPLPVYDGVDQIIMTFNKPVTSSTGELLDYLTITDECGLGTDYSPTGVSVSGDGLTVTWTFGSTFHFGEWVMTLSDSIVSGDTPFDGDWDGRASKSESGGTSEFNDGGTSGDGDYGGDFVFNYALLMPGDADMNGYVYDDDVAIVTANLGMSSGATWADGDFDFDGDVDNDDLVICNANYYTCDWDTPLHVTNVEVANSGIADSEVFIPTAAGDDEQLRPLVVHDGVDQVILTFDMEVGSTTGELLGYLTLTDDFGEGSDYYAASVSISPDGKTVTWTFSTTFDVGAFVLHLSDQIKNEFDVRLDGEWDGPEYFGDTSGTSQFYNDDMSGNGWVGGDFTFAFSLMLPGDANRDGSVDDIDLAIVSKNYNTTGGATWEMGDFNGDGNVDLLDFDTWGTYSGDVYWPAPDVIETSGPAVDQVFQLYGFANDDPEDDPEPGDPEWTDFVDDLFEALELV
jgi:hypothetical protein